MRGIAVCSSKPAIIPESATREIAEAEKINRSYVRRVLRLALLAPEIVEVILDGRQPDGMTRPGLMKPFPVEWERQRQQLT